ncbi:1,4-alpha-glucan branching protein GlgB [Natronospira bacteriovora]|uniref:1,4-alpha-glucan branching enzyme GlgB n=1 Tax=Natronospira bacteriovora TaxID=3069753 RepID=A0ABU0W552_9GAMM|nr:1,4-alpha-glucan branching protein GlgB [Natronospira sp. AB-CW4]MDQ2069038.1 1,4-alpha-glucan branching protein GlgB [Natronospira sp. AB-CW4]
MPARSVMESDVLRLVQGRHHAPHAVLGCQGRRYRAWRPGAKAVWLEPGRVPMKVVHPAGLFECPLPEKPATEPWILVCEYSGGETARLHDPYQFAPDLDWKALVAFGEGHHCRAWQIMGAHCMDRDAVAGTRFSVWAPNAERVSVVGDFNNWNGLSHPMSVHGESGVWELFIPGLAAGALYKFEIHNQSGEVTDKGDPYARHWEVRPRTGCLVPTEPGHEWGDAAWMRERPDWRHAPISIYELHAGSWRRNADGSFLGYRQLADALVETLQDSGFSHVELMPITEHPFDASWGYQTTGYFAPTSRFGNPDDFRYFVDRLHQAGIGVILDWVPAHFPRDPHGLARFDGSALYEHADPRRGETAEWDTLAFNFGRKEVMSFLLSSALYWLEEFHLDGLRIDAVAAMLYLDYGRKEGEWLPNIHGGRENLEAVAFLQALNTMTHRECPGSMTIAEESTAWPGVTRPVHLGGLGFSMKWNMGWMHDTLAYFRHDPVHRRFHHDSLTFGLLYAFSENFVLPFSHDEVVHGKGSLLDRMPGDRWQRFANLRLLYAYLYAYPGKKLMFMGNELAQTTEWSHDGQLPEALGAVAEHAGVKRLIRDLNHLYRDRPALHRGDFDAAGFEWIDCHDADQSVISFLRREPGRDGAEARHVLAICNFTPIVREDYRIGLPEGGAWREIFNSDAEAYGGSGVGNLGQVSAIQSSWMGRPWSVALRLPPLGAVYLEWRERS